VDNAPSTDATRSLVGATPFRYLREDRPGLDWARNLGMNAATHDIVAYTDDDARVEPTWLRGLADAFAQEGIAAVTGLVLPLTLATRAQRLYECYGTGMSRGPTPRRFVAATMRSREFIEVQQVGVGANMAFRRDVLRSLGGFDPALDAGTPAGGAGDLDMFHRVLVAGGDIAYQPAAVVRHRHRETSEALRQQLYDNGKSYGVYLLKLWRTRTVSRPALLAYVVRRRLPWLVGRLLRGLLGRHPLPLSLLWAELWGSLHSMSAYRETYGRRSF